MDTPEVAGDWALICRVGERICTLPIACVRETMRPLPVEKVEGAPPFVLGLSVIRGVPTPVVSLGFMLTGSTGEPRRFVLIELDGSRIALSVDGLERVMLLDRVPLAELPPLLSEALDGTVARIGVLDSRLLLVLEASRLLPEAVWTELRRGLS